MPGLSDCHEPGILIVVAQPVASQYINDCHEWYNTEHGPARLKLGDEFFLNGYRYRMREDDLTWLAIYDMRRLSAGSETPYTSLRENRSPREQDVLGNKIRNLSRQFFKLVEQMGAATKPADTICMAVFEAEKDAGSSVRDSYSKLFDKFSTEYSCLRSRLFELVDGTHLHEHRTLFLSIHDLDGEQKLDGDQYSLKTEIEKCLSQAGADLAGQGVHLFDFFHEFLAEDYRSPHTLHK